MKKELTGKLEMEDNLKYEYIIKDGDQELNISEILNTIIDSDYNAGKVFVEKQGKILFDEEGIVCTKKDKLGIDCYFICGANLDNTLLEHMGDYLTVKVEKLYKEATK